MREIFLYEGWVISSEKTTDKSACGSVALEIHNAVTTLFVEAGWSLRNFLHKK